MRKIFRRVATVLAFATPLAGCLGDLDRLNAHVSNRNAGISASDTVGACRLSVGLNTSGYSGLGLRC